MSDNSKPLTFWEYLEKAVADYPHDGAPEAIRAARIMSGWHCHCERTGRAPDLPPVDGKTTEEPEVAARWRAEASSQAQRARAYGSWGSAFSADRMGRDWLAVHGRSAGGQPLAKPAT